MCVYISVANTHTHTYIYIYITNVCLYIYIYILCVNVKERELGEVAFVTCCICIWWVKVKNMKQVCLLKLFNLY